MLKRVMAFTVILAVITLTLFSCNNNTGKVTSDPEKEVIYEEKAQMVVAVSPIIVYDDETTAIAYNDIKNSMKTDAEAAKLTSMDAETSWQWVTKAAEGWKKRAVYTLDRWINGAGASSQKAYAYSFSIDKKTSLVSFTAQSTGLTSYSGGVPDYGVLVSATGADEEALCYTITQDGVLTIPEGTMTAIKEVEGIKTGFLAEDDTVRKASARIMINNQQIWSGDFLNSTAAEDGEAVTELFYPLLTDIKVSAGDMVFFAFQLEAEANREGDISVPTREEKWSTITHANRVEVEEESKTDSNTSSTPSAGSSEKPVSTDGSVPIIFEYASTFVLLRSTEMSTDMVKVVAGMADKMVNVLNTDIRVRNEGHDESTYEIVLGRVPERPKSVEIYNEIINARTNNANDFIIRLVGTKLYIQAGNAVSLQAAVDYFMSKFCTDDKGVIPKNYNYVNRPVLSTANIAGVSVGNFVIRTEKYPSYIVTKAAQEMQKFIIENCGYLAEIKPMTDDGKHYSYEIQAGPMNGSVKVTTSGERFTNETAAGNINIQPDGLLDVAKEAYKISFSGNHLVVNGGSQYAVNAGVLKVISLLKSQKAVAAGYSFSGSYDGDFSLTGGYSLAFAEEFSYSGTAQEIETNVKKRWTISSDKTNGPTELSPGVWDEQRRPGIYGQNYWIQKDAKNNGYLLEITKKESYGYDAGRLISQNKWAFRYGIWETRIVMGTRNGACSAIWAAGGAPLPVSPGNEIDVYENYGKDSFYANIHTWAPESEGGHVNHVAAGDMSRVVVEPARNEHFWDTFHYFAIEWTENYLNFYFDGVCFVSVDITPAKLKAFRGATTIKLANGVGTGTYSKGYDPYDFMDDVTKFFEVQTVDYTRIYQTSNEGKSATQQNQLRFSTQYIGDPIG